MIGTVGPIWPGVTRRAFCSSHPDVPVKGIRLVTLWRCPSHDPSPCGDTLMRHGVLGVGPTSGPQRGTPFAPRGPVGPVPPLRRYYGALRLLAVHLAALRFLRLAIITVSSPIRPHRLGTGAVDQPGVGKPGSMPAVNDEDGKVSHVPVKPVQSFAMFLRPRCDQARRWVQV
jgi:hypothetical protein